MSQDYKHGWQDAKEECARVCDMLYTTFTSAGTLSLASGAAQCSSAIRALAPGGQNAAEHLLKESGKFFDWGNAASVALKNLLDAYERRIRSECTPEQLEKKPWECMEYVEARRILEAKPNWFIAIDAAFHPAPAEVAEGAGEESLRQRVNGAVARGWCWKRNEHKEMDSDLASAIADEVMMALRAAPSLSIDFDLLQTLRMRCNYIINGYSDAKLEAKEMGRLIGEALLAKVREAGKT